jgi:hypothetical protein
MRIIVLSIVASGLMMSSAVVMAGPGPGAGKGMKMPSEEKPSVKVDPNDYDVGAVTEQYLKTAIGGTLRVTANESSDARQIGLIRATLQRRAQDFVDAYKVPKDAPGSAQSAGLSVLLNAAAGQLRSDFFEVRGGAEIRFSSDSAEIVRALHQWFDDPKGAAPVTSPAALPAPKG